MWAEGQQGVCSAKAAWQAFRCDAINSSLRAELSEAEVEHNDPEGALKDMQEYIASLEQFSLTFPTRETHSPDQRVVLQLSNTGGPSSIFCVEH